MTKDAFSIIVGILVARYLTAGTRDDAIAAAIETAVAISKEVNRAKDKAAIRFDVESEP